MPAQTVSKQTASPAPIGRWVVMETVSLERGTVSFCPPSSTMANTERKVRKVQGCHNLKNSCLIIKIQDADGIIDVSMSEESDMESKQGDQQDLGSPPRS